MTSPTLAVYGADDRAVCCAVTEAMVRAKGEVDPRIAPPALAYLRTDYAETLRHRAVTGDRKAERRLHKEARQSVAKAVGAGPLSVILFLRVLYWVAVIVRWYLSDDAKAWVAANQARRLAL